MEATNIHIDSGCYIITFKGNGQMMFVKDPEVIGVTLVGEKICLDGIDKGGDKVYIDLENVRSIEGCGNERLEFTRQLVVMEARVRYLGMHERLKGTQSVVETIEPSEDKSKEKEMDISRPGS